MKIKENGYLKYLDIYLKERPMFLSLIRAKEAIFFQRELPLKSPVLDVGVGDGFFAKTVFGSVDYGIDIAGSRMKEAGKFGVYKELLIYDGVHIPMPDKSVNTVVSNCVLEHVSDITNLTKEIYRVLKPGGKFLTTVMAAPWEDYLFGARIFGDAYKKWMRKKQVHLNVFTHGQWQSLFKKQGFKIEKSTGYLTPYACALIDISHYLSALSLVTYKIVGKWVIFPPVLPLPKNTIVRILAKNIDAESAGTVFYVISKEE
jgi:ubiquinone/menaquinone biosynthesis C-methylase UbiE